MNNPLKMTQMKISDIIDVDFSFLLFHFLFELYSFVLWIIIIIWRWRIRVTFWLTKICKFSSNPFSKLDVSCRIALGIQILRDVTLSLELFHFIGQIFEDDITFFVLELTQTAENKIAGLDPDFSSHFPSDVPNAHNLVEAFNVDSAVA